MASANSGKDTIYIDIDDEITAVIEKVKASDEKIVALVLPKRASVLQSIVNMKLLKRSADTAKKHVVLITSEAGLLPLAGAVGFHVAKNLQTKPEIPVTPATPEDEIIDDETLDGPADEPEVTAASAGNKSIGELAAATGAGVAADEGIETLALDDDSDGGGDAADAAAADPDSKAAKKQAKKDKKLAVPSFDKFRLRLIIGAVVLVLLIVLFYVCNSILPKATLTLTTDTSDVNSSLSLNLDTTTKTLDPVKLIVPATVQKLDKSGSQQVTTTGKKNTGEKATGTIVASETCTKKVPTIPAGVGFTSGGLVFITQDDLDMNPSGFDSQGNFICSGSVDVTAQQGGAQYNLASGSKFSYGNVSGTNNSALSGGTDNIIQVVAQADIDSASQKLTSQSSGSVKAQLQDQLKQAGLYPIASTFVAGDPVVTPSSKVGDQASTLTVTQVTSYTMFGVKQSDLKTLVDTDVKKHIDPSKQSILDEGIDKATFHVNNATATAAQVAFSTTATAGPDLNVDTIKQQAAGKKSGDIVAQLKGDPGVRDVNVDLSPFWVNHIPGKTSKITVVFQKAAQ